MSPPSRKRKLWRNETSGSFTFVSSTMLDRKGDRVSHRDRPVARPHLPTTERWIARLEHEMATKPWHPRHQIDAQH